MKYSSNYLELDLILLINGEINYNQLIHKDIITIKFYVRNVELH